MKLNEVFKKDYLDGMKAGIKICQDIAEKNGFEIHFPDLDEMEIEKDDDCMGARTRYDNEYWLFKTSNKKNGG